jgi:hypothetical protein
MTAVARFTQECPGLAGSLGRLYGRVVAEEFAQHYALVADLGGNDELGVVREAGVSFNPRIARVISLVIQDCDEVTPHVLKVTVYSTLSLDADVPAEFRSDVSAVRESTLSSPAWVSCIALALMLDRVRHLHMADIPVRDKEVLLSAVASSPLLTPGVGSPENLRLKVIHGLDMQRRRIKMDGVE